MGYRGWITPVESLEEFNKLSTAIENNEFAYYINYVIKLKEDLSDFEKGQVLVMWCGDTGLSLSELSEERLRMLTTSLDWFLEDVPGFHEDPLGPAEYGTVYTSETIQEAFI